MKRLLILLTLLAFSFVISSETQAASSDLDKVYKKYDKKNKKSGDQKNAFAKKKAKKKKKKKCPKSGCPGAN